MSLALRPYGNLAQNSGVSAYAVQPGAILVQFRNGATYRYDATSPGAEHVRRMQQLARSGKGLSTYISRYVGERYAAKVFTTEEDVPS